MKHIYLAPSLKGDAEVRCKVSCHYLSHVNIFWLPFLLKKIPWFWFSWAFKAQQNIFARFLTLVKASSQRSSYDHRHRSPAALWYDLALQTHRLGTSCLVNKVIYKQPQGVNLCRRLATFQEAGERQVCWASTVTWWVKWLPLILDPILECWFKSWLFHFWSSSPLNSLERQQLWLYYLCERSRRSSGFLTSAWPSSDCHGHLGSKLAHGRSFLSDSAFQNKSYRILQQLSLKVKNMQQTYHHKPFEV